MPAVRRFKPELIIVSCGFDGSAMDPLGRMLCTSETYRAMARMTLELAQEICNGRVVMLHEGGYSTAYVPNCGLAVIEEMAVFRTECLDPFLPVFQSMGGQDLQPHQRQVIQQAKRLVERVPVSFG
jgi:acetoin utilization deacetylase AcuC-like enzyme